MMFAVLVLMIVVAFMIAALILFFVFNQCLHLYLKGDYKDVPTDDKEIEIQTLETERNYTDDLLPFEFTETFKIAVTVKYFIHKIVGDIQIIDAVQRTQVVLPELVRFHVKLLPSSVQWKTRWERLSLNTPLRIFTLEPLLRGVDYTVCIELYGRESILCFSRFYGHCMIPLTTIQALDGTSDTRLEVWMLPK